MQMKSKIGLITMCAKAGRLAMGMDMMKDSCKNGSAKGIFVASDISDKSLKEARYCSSRYDVGLWALDMTMDELMKGLGKRVGVLAVCDSGFAKSCAKGLEKIIIEDDKF
ncbi:MAG: 50S ribosomal protein L7 [Ruminococcus sp.]|nr:50S ribosomal protein L7 [Ruminococcus sp.]